MHPKFGSFTKEEYQNYMQLVREGVLKEFAAHEMSSEQSLEVLASTVGCLLGSVRIYQGEFEMRMVEARFIEMVHQYAEQAKSVTKENASKAFDKDGEVDLRDI